MRKAGMFAVLMLAVFSLSSCFASRPVKPDTQIVRVPVVVPCVESMPVRPVFEVSLLKQTDDLPKITDAYMIERHQRIAYEAELEGVLSGCVHD